MKKLIFTLFVILFTGINLNAKIIDIPESNCNDYIFINNPEDEFGDPTNQHYLCCAITGTFSNSATTGSKCFCFLTYKYIKNKYIYKLLFMEYGQYWADLADKCTVKMKVTWNEESDAFTCTFNINKYGEPDAMGILWLDRVFNSQTGLSPQKVQFYVTSYEYSLSTYKFDIDCKDMKASFDYYRNNYGNENK